MKNTTKKIENTSPRGYLRGKNPNSHKHGLFKVGHKTNVGRIASEITRKKISDKAKARPKRIGWQHSKATRKKLREAKLGDKNPQWKGGTYQRDRFRLEHKLWREAVFARDNWTCQLCGERGGRLNADHIKSWALFPELRTAINNGRTVCEDCHKDTETYGKHN